MQIYSREKCCGCGVCALQCPSRAIVMREDNLGFPYPTIDCDKCTQCGRCRKVCPGVRRLKRKPESFVLNLFAAKSKNNFLRSQSSSGGVFSELAIKVLEDGGCVVGAVWDEKSRRVQHCIIDNMEALVKLRGSKYVQSILGSVFIDVRHRLNQGTKVLFSGTPCQTSALRTFIGGEMDNLITVNIICHGVASPFVLGSYLNAVSHENISNCHFRDKEKGWKKFSLRIDTTEGKQYNLGDLSENIFLRGFLSNLYLRPSCHNCVGEYKLKSDLTLGDYWNIASIKPTWDDDLGVSAVLVSTAKGQNLWQSIQSRVDSLETPLAPFFSANRNILLSSPKHPKAKLFASMYVQSPDKVISLIRKYLPWGWLPTKLWKIRRHFQKRAMLNFANRFSCNK